MAIVVVVGGGIGLFKYFESRKRDKFVDDWDTYTELHEQMKQPRQWVEAPLPQSKVLVIDMTKGPVRSKLDPIFFKLEKDVRATTPEEVGCVCFLTWGKELIGTYSDGASGYAATCKLDLVDLESGVMVVTRSFQGEDPPENKDSHGSETGERPNEKIIDFLSKHLDWQTAAQMKVWRQEQKDVAADRVTQIRRDAESEKEDRADRLKMRAEEQRMLLAEQKRVAEQKRLRRKEEDRLAVEKAKRDERQARVDNRYEKFEYAVLKPGLEAFDFAAVSEGAKLLAEEEEFPELHERMRQMRARFTSYRQLHDASATILAKKPYGGTLKNKSGSALSGRGFTATDGKLEMSLGQGKAKMDWGQLHPESYVILLEHCARNMPEKQSAIAEGLIRQIEQEFQQE